ncbi:DUF6978 family protein [Paenibacillus yonginensis]|uniref:DUF6978 family protein n=1 Tax=Paenibacillus yonginensis TaxID=1462996 RepID=UPI001244A3C9|nr:hypothetical protein [Paenibacillus yonginensis]
MAAAYRCGLWQTGNRPGLFIDVNRKGTINVKKRTFQTRYQKSIVLLRLDISGSPHRNPDDEVIECPHLHSYREGYGTSWAYPIDGKTFSNLENLAQALKDFLVYNHVEEPYPSIAQIQTLI